MLFIAKFYRRPAMTLTELLVVLVILGITAGLFHTVFITSWRSYQERITQANLWQDANDIVEKISREIRGARRFAINNQENTKSVALFNTKDTTQPPFVTYVMQPGGENGHGQFVIQRPGEANQILSQNVNLAQSSFADDGNTAFKINLALHDEVFRRTLQVNTSSEIYLRNR